MEPIYNEIGINYSTTRGTDPRIAEQIHAHLKGASQILNIGAGTGSYEPKDANLIALEPSKEMITQRKPDSHPVVQGFAENLPFEDDDFSHTMTVLSMHHWKNHEQAFQEINRVTTEKFIAVSWDPTAPPFWLTRDYFPEVHEMDQVIFPSWDLIHDFFNKIDITPLYIPEDCIDGFLAAFWKRPEAYLIEDVRRSISAFSKIERVPERLEKLRQDLTSGEWTRKNKEVLKGSVLDAGYVLITARTRRQ